MLSDSTRRALRTAYQTVIGALAVIGVLVAFIPQLQATFPQVAGFALSIAAGAALVSKALNALEDAGLIPAWLKEEPTGRHEAPKDEVS